MNCPLKSDDSSGLLLDYSAGKLDRQRSKAFELHMINCADCAGFYREQTALWQTLSAWEPQPVSMSFNRTLWQKIEEAAAAPWYRRLADGLRFGAWKPAFPLAAALLLVGAGFVMDHPGADKHRVTASGVSVTDAEQVEKTLDDLQLLGQFDAGYPVSKAM